MPDPITVGAIALNVGCGIGGNVMQALGVGGYRRVADILSRGTAAENHDILKATHAAYVEAMEVMAASCSALALGQEGKAGAKQLKALVKRKDFRDFRFDGEHFPLTEANAAIDRMFTGGIGAGGGADDEHRAYNRIVVDDLAVWGVALPSGLVALFVDGAEGHGPWHLVFRTAFAEQVKSNQTAFRILTWERLGELRAMGIAVLDQFAALHEKVDRLNLGQTELKAMLREVLDNQAPGSERASIELLQPFADGFAEDHPNDFSGLKSYLLQKIRQWHEFRARIEALEAEGNRDAALLADARSASGRGDFEGSDALLAEAEEVLDEKLDALLVAKSERRSLRGDNAKLAGNYEAAVNLYDSAEAMLPRNERRRSFDLKYRSATLLLWWYDRGSDSDILSKGRQKIDELIESINGTFDDTHEYSVRINIARSIKEMGESICGEALISTSLKMLNELVERAENDEFPISEECVANMEYAGCLLRYAELPQSSRISAEEAISYYRELLRKSPELKLSDHDTGILKYGLSACLQLIAEKFDDICFIDESIDSFLNLVDFYCEYKQYDLAIQCELNYGRSVLTKAKILGDATIAEQAHEVLEVALADVYDYSPHLRPFAEKLLREAYEYEKKLAEK